MCFSLGENNAVFLALGALWGVARKNWKDEQAQRGRAGRRRWEAAPSFIERRFV